MCTGAKHMYERTSTAESATLNLSMIVEGQKLPFATKNSPIMHTYELINVNILTIE